MKVGDRLLCKKNYYHSSPTVNVGTEIYTEDKYYTITSINGSGIEVKSHVNVRLWFGDDIYKLRIKDYFYTVKEIRKLKLEKISKGMKRFLNNNDWILIWFTTCILHFALVVYLSDLYI